MIGQFRYAKKPPDDTVAVRMLFSGQDRMGVLVLPIEIREAAKAQDYPLTSEGEALALPFALGYAVTMAMLGERMLYLTGDKCAWDNEWGGLSSAN